MKITEFSGMEMSEVERAADGLPKAWPIFRAGENIVTRRDSMPVNLELSQEDLQNIAAYQRAKGTKIPIDCQHVVSNLAGKLGLDEPELLKRLPRYSGVAGFGNLEAREGSLYLTDAEWLPIGAEVMKAGQYRYFSPTIRGLDGKSPLRVMSVALTNNPCLQHCADLAASEDEEVTPEEVRAAQENIIKHKEADMPEELKTEAAVAAPAAPEPEKKADEELLGFQTVEPHFFTLRESLFPRLITDEHPEGLELPRNKFIVHQFRRKPDPARAGKIRVLAWLHCLQNWPLKDLFSFIERFGMPFVVARVDQNTWDNEREVLKNVIRSFGPDGGGVFTNSTEIQLLNAANTGGDNVYFRALEFTHNAIYTLLVGQLASSGDSSGMSNGDAQTAVRQDILEADARAVEATIRAQVAAPWTRFHYGDRAAAPLLRFKVRPPEDEKAVADKALVKAQTVQTLAAAGYVIPAEEIQKVFGYTVEYHEPMQGNQMPLSGLTEPAGPEEPDAHTLNLKQKYDAMGVAIRAGLLTATPEIEEQTRAELGLPAMSPEVQKAWEATGGIRQPITLKTAESEAVNDALDVKDESVAMRAETPRTELADALEAWLGPEADARAATAELSDEELDRELRNGAPMIVNSILNADSSGFEKLDAANMRRSFDDGNQIRNRE